MPTTSDLVRFEGVSKRFRYRTGRTLKESIPVLVRHGIPNTFYALRDVSFEVGRGETLGIIGRNGSGKSTILKLAAQVMAPTEGRVWTGGRVAPLIELGSCFHPDLTGRENILLNASVLGLPNREARGLVDEIVAFAEMERFLDLPIKRFSAGMALRLAFSVATHCRPDVLLVDEQLAVGDKAFQEKCVARMRQFQSQGGSILIVTHNLDLISEFCDRALLLEGGRKVAEGSAASVLEEYLATASNPPEAPPAREPLPFSQRRPSL